MLYQKRISAEIFFIVQRWQVQFCCAIPQPLQDCLVTHICSDLSIPARCFRETARGHLFSWHLHAHQLKSVVAMEKIIPSDIIVPVIRTFRHRPIEFVKVWDFNAIPYSGVLPKCSTPLFYHHTVNRESLKLTTHSSNNNPRCWPCCATKSYFVGNCDNL